MPIKYYQHSKEHRLCNHRVDGLTSEEYFLRVMTGWLLDIRRRLSPPQLDVVRLVWTWSPDNAIRYAHKMGWVQPADRDDESQWRLTEQGVRVLRQRAALVLLEEAGRAG